MLLFKRSAHIVINKQGATTGKLLNLRLHFKVENAAGLDGGMPESATISVYNASTDSMNILRDSTSTVQLFAGYAEKTSLLFNGTPVKVPSMKREGGDKVLEIELMGSPTAYDTAHVEFALPVGGTNAQALNYALQALSSYGVARGSITALPLVYYAMSRSYSGHVRDLLDELCANVGYVWNITRGEININPKGQGMGTTADAILLTEKTGLIGLPTKDLINEGAYTFKSLLNPDIVPQALLSVESAEIQGGIFTAGQVSHEGDNWEGPWETTVEAWER